jgi:hypothetical protein
VLGERLLVGGEFGFQPTVRVVGFGVGVQFWVAGDGEVDGVDDGALGEPVAVVRVIFFEEAGDA